MDHAITSGDLPCPFCGSAKLESGGDDKYVGVRCLDCEAIGPNHYGTGHEWNIRIRQTNKKLHIELAAIAADRNRQSLRIAALEAELATTKRVIAWANNSLFGSYSYFLSLNGGDADEHILDTAIENLKDAARKLTTLTAQRDAAVEALSDKAVSEAMQDTWNDICADTDCHPLDIQQLGRRNISFSPNHWAWFIANRLRSRSEAARSVIATIEKDARG